MVDPDWITGFTDGEGCFSLFVHKDKQKRKNGDAVIYYRWTAIFIIGLRGDDKKTVEKLRDFFDCGNVITTFTKETAHLHNFGKAYYSLRSIKELASIIIPHFDKYPLQSKKQDDYILWREAVLILAKYRVNNALFTKITISPDDRLRVSELHKLMRKRVTGSRITWDYKNIDMDGEIENLPSDGQLDLL